MEDEAPLRRGDAASLLSGESLDSYSQAELDARILQLEAEIARVKAHRDKAAAHRLAAEAFFQTKRRDFTLMVRAAPPKRAAASYIGICGHRSVQLPFILTSYHPDTTGS